MMKMILELNRIINIWRVLPILLSLHFTLLSLLLSCHGAGQSLLPYLSFVNRLLFRVNYHVLIRFITRWYLIYDLTLFLLELLKYNVIRLWYFYFSRLFWFSLSLLHLIRSFLNIIFDHFLLSFQSIKF